MKDRRFKVHYLTGLNKAHRTLCGVDGTTTVVANAMTCRICMFKYLAMQTPWAQGFLDELRGRVGRGQPAAVVIPAATAKPTNGKVEGTGHGQAGPFGQQGIPQETIRKIFTEAPAWDGPVQPVMDNGGSPAQSVGVQPREIPQGPGDTGQVGYEPRRYYKAD